ncbi:unnamed protein product, partial [Ixodes pacificus]
LLVDVRCGELVLDDHHDDAEEGHDQGVVADALPLLEERLATAQPVAHRGLVEAPAGSAAASSGARHTQRGGRPTRTAGRPTLALEEPPQIVGAGVRVHPDQRDARAVALARVLLGL